jgi:hypothetical protein
MQERVAGSRRQIEVDSRTPRTVGRVPLMPEGGRRKSVDFHRLTAQPKATSSDHQRQRTALETDSGRSGLAAGTALDAPFRPFNCATGISTGRRKPVLGSSSYPGANGSRAGCRCEALLRRRGNGSVQSGNQLAANFELDRRACVSRRRLARSVRRAYSCLRRGTGWYDGR